MSNALSIPSVTYFDLDTLAQVEGAAKDVYNDVFYKMGEGEHVLRFLPGLNGEKPVEVMGTHYLRDIPGQDPTKTFSFVCPASVGQGRCPVCDRALALKDSRDPSEQALASEWGVKFRAYANVYVRSKNQVKILGFSKSVFNGLVLLRKSARMGGDFTETTGAGFDVIINRVGTDSKNTKYTVYADRERIPLANSAEEINEILSQAYSLRAQIVTTIPQEILDFLGSGRSYLTTTARQTSVSAPRPHVPALAPGGQQIGASFARSIPTITPTPAKATSFVSLPEED